jgi:hypothetical protein
LGQEVVLVSKVCAWETRGEKETELGVDAAMEGEF